MLDKKGDFACCPSIKKLYEIPFLFNHLCKTVIHCNITPLLDKQIVQGFPTSLGKKKIPSTKKRYTLISIESSIISWYLSTKTAKIHPVGMTLPTNSNKVHDNPYYNSQYLLPWEGYMVVRISFHPLGLYRIPFHYVVAALSPSICCPG